MEATRYTENEYSNEDLLTQVLRKEVFPMGLLKNLESFSKFRTLTADTPDYIDKITAFLETDFYLAAQCIFNANSYKFKDRARVENLKQAIVRVSIQTIQGFGLNYNPMVDGVYNNQKWDYWTQKLTTHSVLTGQLCFSYATVFRGKNPENCYLVGFFHEIGTLSLMKLLIQESAKHPGKSYPSGSGPDDTPIVELRKVGNKFGAAILNKLHFPKFAIQSLMPANPEGSECDYFKRALETVHIIEDCLKNHLFPPGFASPSSAGSAEFGTQEEVPVTRPAGEWTEACNQAVDLIREKFPDMPVEVSNVEQIANQTRENLKKLVNHIPFLLVG